MSREGEIGTGRQCIGGGEGDGNAERALNKWFWHDSIPNFHAGYLYTAKYAHY